MNILFLNLLKFSSFEEHNIYTDLLRALIKNGHNVFAVCPSERRLKEKTNIKRFGTSSILTVKTFNIQKTNIIEKGIGTLSIKKQFIGAIKKYYKGVQFDMILYPTPPITLCGVVEYFKKRDNAKTYLMLKDIFPQNAVDLGMMKTTGVKGLIYKYFRKQEKKLYAISDRIGCMSPANVEYVLKHNPEVSKEKVEVFPNCIEPQDISLTEEEKTEIRNKYGLPLDKKIFVYGGNLGKPQGIPFIIECLRAEKDNEKVFFLIIGDGTEYGKLEKYYNESRQTNFKLLRRLPSNEFDKVLCACDVGLIFLDHRFTIPNFPSRLLSYLQAGLPVLACTDTATDIGKTIVENDFGWWCDSDDVQEIKQSLKIIINSRNISNFGLNSKLVLIKKYNVESWYNEVLSEASYNK